MSAYTNFAIIKIRIIFTLLQELAIARGIIVERNLHAYYKLPIKPAQYTIPQEYHILQCPYQNTSAIPTPENMDICVIINSYREEMKNATTTHTTKSPLHTKVKYQMPRKYRDVPMQLTKRPNTHPYMIVIRPMRMGTESNCRYAKRLRLKPLPYYVEHLGIVKKDNCRTLVQQSPLQSVKPPDQRTASARGRLNIVAKVKPITEHVEENVGEIVEKVADNSAVDSKAEASMDSEEAKSQSESEEEYADYGGHNKTFAKESILAPKTSVLKYLGTKDAIEKLSKLHSRDRTLPMEGTERYFAEHNDLQRGEKAHGFQNYYHRDEIFNDHIFYDDLQQQGEYVNRDRA
ncbi:PREDICTED: uncharacterized protein LOC108371366 [Rhagoletis zephyria]|uniref:uncharacterized protein LOC108371366 n=1 Tax=Rhagoletis zephyria TaxID=28612 RepID=UPI0008118DBC|nr:PREDICTED: uncharacterized protein LOC108371366 [Rhagoletis zephyria]